MDDIPLESLHDFHASTVEDLAPLADSLSLVKRYDGGLRVCDLRGCEGLADFSVFDEVVDQLERVGAPAKLSIWVVPEDAVAAWDGAGAWSRMTGQLYRLVMAHRASPPAGEALVIAGTRPPNPAVVFMLKSLGLGVYRCLPGDPLPAIAVETAPGTLLVAMIGEGL